MNGGIRTDAGNPMPLSDAQCRNARPRDRAFKLYDAGGLHLLVQPSGSRLWRMKYRFNNREKQLAFGPYPVVGLADARERRDAAKLVLLAGKDPATGQTTDRTFEKIARAWHRNREDGLDGAHALRVMARMERDIFPAIGHIEIEKIDAPTILAMIRDVEARGALDISRRVRQNVGQVFRFAIAHGWARDNPAEHLKGALKPKPRVRHMARVPLSEVGDLVRGLASARGPGVEALRFTMLTWARTAETRGARWSEIEGDRWRVPKERMKMGREHIVPLSRQAVALLKRQPRQDALIWPGMNQNSMLYALARMGYAGLMTVHGIRGLASTWANESGRYDSDWIERALAHDETDAVRGAYNSAEYLQARAVMLQDWADWLDSHLVDDFDELLKVG